MNADPTTDAALRARIDTADFAETLAADSDGSFAKDVSTYLEAWKAKIKGYQDAGLSSAEFNDLTRLSTGIQTAERVIEFFVKLQKLPPAQ